MCIHERRFLTRRDHQRQIHHLCVLSWNIHHARHRRPNRRFYQRRHPTNSRTRRRAASPRGRRCDRTRCRRHQAITTFRVVVNNILP